MVRGAQSVGPALQDFYVNNLTSVALSPGYALTGTIHLLPPNPLNPITTGRFLLTAPNPTAAPVTQIYYYTDTPANPAAGKTCRWQLTVSVVNGLCTGQISVTPFNTAVCGFLGSQSFVDANSCQAQIVTSIQ